MDSNLDKILKTVEKISFSVIGLLVSALLFHTVETLGVNSYGMTLLNGISVYLVVGGVIILLWVTYNIFSINRLYREHK